MTAVHESTIARAIGKRLYRDLEEIDDALPLLAYRMKKAALAEQRVDERIHSVDLRMGWSSDEDEPPGVVLTVWSKMNDDAAFSLTDRLADRRRACERELGLPSYTGGVIVHWLDGG